MTREPSPREFMAGETERFLVEALAPGDASRPAGTAGAAAPRPLETGADATRRSGTRAAAPRLLEVGAGDGRLAARLAARGWDVTACEPDAKRAAAARARAVRVIEADFLDPDPFAAQPPFDVVFFSRVLHHLEPLDRAIELAEARLAPGGLVVGEEFAYERADDAAIRWLAATRAAATAQGLLPDEPDPARETLDAWRRHHAEQHRIHRGDVVMEALGRRFEVTREERPAYLYRYLCTRLVDSAEAAGFADAACAEEARAIGAGRLPAVGLRFVAKHRRG